MHRMRRLLVIVAVLAGTTATTGAASTGAVHGPLTGTWKVSAGCHGNQTLDRITNGYYHYRRHIAPGSTCFGGDIDCIEREGVNVEDTITPRPGGWQRSGTLHRWLPGLTAARLVKLRAMVRSAVKTNGDAHPSSVMVYASRRHEANIAAGAGTGVFGHQPVYLVVARGHFTCSGCGGPGPSTPPSGSVITLIVDRTTLQSLDFGFGGQVDTSMLAPGLPLQLG